MIRRFFIFLLIILIVPLFCFSSFAASSGTVYFIHNSYTDLSILNTTGETLSVLSDGGFSLYFPSTLYNDTILSGTSYFVCSGSFSIDFTSSGTYNLSTVYPTHLRSVLTENGTYRNNVDITQSYNSTLGVTRYSSSNVSFVSQTHFLPTSDSLVFSFIFVTSASSRIDTCIDYFIPSFSGSITASEIKTFNVEAPSTAVEDSINTLITSTTSGLGGVQTAVNALSSLTQSNFASTEQLLNSLDAAISDLKGSVTDSVNDALDQWESENLDSSKSEITDAVSDVQDSIDEVFDFSDVQEATSIIYDAVSTNSMDPQIDIPAFTLNLFGQTFTFWDSIHFDFQSIYNTLTSIAVFNILLTVFRFTIVCGCIYYCWHWLNKLINLVLLESDGSYGYATHAAKFPIEREISRRERGGK